LSSQNRGENWGSLVICEEIVKESKEECQDESTLINYETFWGSYFESEHGVYCWADLINRMSLSVGALSEMAQIVNQS